MAARLRNQVLRLPSLTTMPFRIDDIVFGISALALGGAVAVTGGGTHPTFETQAIQQQAAAQEVQVGSVPTEFAQLEPAEQQATVTPAVSDGQAVGPATTQEQTAIVPPPIRQSRGEERERENEEREYEDD